MKTPTPVPDVYMRRHFDDNRCKTVRVVLGLIVGKVGQVGPFFESVFLHRTVCFATPFQIDCLFERIDFQFFFFVSVLLQDTAILLIELCKTARIMCHISDKGAAINNPRAPVDSTLEGLFCFLARLEWLCQWSPTIIASAVFFLPLHLQMDIPPFHLSKI